MSDKRTLTELLHDGEKWSIFSKLLETTGAGEWLTLDQQFTVLAPTNDAFDKFTKAKLDELVNEPEQKTLKLLLSYHFLPGKLHSEDLAANPRKAITGEELVISNSEGLQVNGANLQARNIQASNGVIHQIDTVLAPPMKTAIKRSPLEAAKTVSATPSQTPPAIGSPTRRSSTIF
jgi:uncharacterized surface protein with fasciclin (FAS1) repeats